MRTLGAAMVPSRLECKKRLSGPATLNVKENKHTPLVVRAYGPYLLPVSDSELALQVLGYIGLVQLRFTLEVLLQAIKKRQRLVRTTCLSRSHG
jgi:hypothetical protein